MSISSTLSSGTMMSSSSDLSMLRSSDIQSVSSMAVVRAPPAPVSLREEQRWVKQLRSKIQNLLQINRNITTEEEIKTPAYDQLREESRVIEEKIALQQERQQRQKPNNFPALSDEAVQTVNPSRLWPVYCCLEYLTAIHRVGPKCTSPKNRRALVGIQH